MHLDLAELNPWPGFGLFCYNLSLVKINFIEVELWPDTVNGLKSNAKRG